MRKKSNILVLFLGVFALIFGILISISPVAEFSKRNFLGWKKVVAEVTSADKKVISDNGFYYEVGASYSESAEKVIEFKYSSKEFPEFGSPKTIYFDEKNTLNFAVGDFSSWNLAVLILPIAGIFLIFLAISSSKKSSSQKFETEEQNLAEISKIQNVETKIFGEITNVESEILPSGMNVGRAVIRAQLPSGEFRNFKSEQIEGLTAGLLVSYLARPSKISVSVRNGDFDDYFVDSEEIIEAIKKSFETVRDVNLEKEKNV